MNRITLFLCIYTDDEYRCRNIENTYKTVFKFAENAPYVATSDEWAYLKTIFRDKYKLLPDKGGFANMIIKPDQLELLIYDGFDVRIVEYASINDLENF